MTMTNESTAIEMKRVSTEETQAVLELWQGSARWLQAKGIRQWHPDDFSLDRVLEVMHAGHELFLARLQGEPVGALYICGSDPQLWEELNDEESGYIHRFAVSRGHSGLGIGDQMLAWAEAYIRSQGRKRVRLDCMADNPRLNQYYLDAGFRHVRIVDWDNGYR
ncbi:GNAT family N-acetyltransferase [Paenibacillus sp. R14(2021)]|uniref:GNAT family N-acetyltransferase n=1 Tax=Paenibacillus sp. R14(2021) TaxID=2859228 RepID=UPI002157F8C2|nr:GNAT family N-acetyltransferase [Paenibacillus sp. R14(2021)]